MNKTGFESETWRKIFSKKSPWSPLMSENRKTQKCSNWSKLVSTGSKIMIGGIFRPRFIFWTCENAFKAKNDHNFNRPSKCSIFSNNHLILAHDHSNASYKLVEQIYIWIFWIFYQKSHTLIKNSKNECNWPSKRFNSSNSQSFLAHDHLKCSS